MSFDDSAAWSDFWGSGKPKKRVVIPVPSSFKRSIPTPSSLRVNALRARMNALNKQRRQLLSLKRKQYISEAVNQRKAIRTFSNALFGSKNIQAANERAKAAGVRLQAEGLVGYGAKGAKAVGNKLKEFYDKSRNKRVPLTPEEQKAVAGSDWFKAEKERIEAERKRKYGY